MEENPEHMNREQGEGLVLGTEAGRIQGMELGPYVAAP